MSCPWRVSAVLCALSLGGVACDDARGPTTAPPPAKPSEPEPTEPSEPSAADEDARATEGAAASEGSSAEPPEPAPPPGPSCDRRGSGSSGPANFTCIDYGRHRGELEPRCAEGVALAEVGCPVSEVVARCSLPATGVRLFYYEGVELDAAARECATLDGDYASGGPSEADAPAP